MQNEILPKFYLCDDGDENSEWTILSTQEPAFLVRVHDIFEEESDYLNVKEKVKLFHEFLLDEDEIIFEVIKTFGEKADSAVYLEKLEEMETWFLGLSLYDEIDE